MKIDKNQVVSVSYTLTVDEEGQEEIVEQTQEGRPFEFVIGSGLMLEAFERALIGKQQGDAFNVSISCDEAYQDYQEDLVIDVDKAIFRNEEGQFAEEEVYQGAFVNLQDEDGNIVPAVVVEVADKTVKVDLNHPLAGYDLNFVGQILNVRTATADELADPQSVTGQVDFE